MTQDLLRALEEPTVDVSTTGRLLGLTKNTVYRACAAGDIPSIRVGGKILIPSAPLKRMLGLTPLGGSDSPQIAA